MNRSGPTPEFAVINGIKKCKGCKKDFPVAEYQRKHGLRPYCRKCSSEIQKTWHKKNLEKAHALSQRWKEKNPERHKFLMWRSNLRRTYGLSEQQYQKLCGDTPRCGICGVERSKNRRLSIDHCHKKKEIRGMLCHRCNSALERIDEIPNWLEKARSYLENSKHIPIASK